MSANVASYSMRVFWSEGDAGFIALCPELDVSAFGETHEEAVRELQVVIRLTLDVYAADGEAPPAPATQASHSGQLRVRLPRSLHARLAADADEEGVSLNTLIVSRLSVTPKVDLSPVIQKIDSLERVTEKLSGYLDVSSGSSQRFALQGFWGDISRVSEVRRTFLLNPSPCASFWPDNLLAEPLQVTSVPQEKQRNAQNSSHEPPITLEGFTLLKLAIETNERFDCDAEAANARLDLSFIPELHPDDPRRFRVTLSVAMEPEMESSNVPYSLSTRSTGYFIASQELAREAVDPILFVNALTIMYGALRGIVLQSTSAAGNGAALLPTVMMVDVVAAQIAREQMPAADAAAPRTKTSTGTKSARSRTVRKRK